MRIRTKLIEVRRTVPVLENGVKTTRELLFLEPEILDKLTGFSVDDGGRDDLKDGDFVDVLIADGDYHKVADDVRFEVVE